MNWLIENQIQVWSWLYFGSIFFIAAAESFFPKRPLHDGMGRRWFNNILIHVLDIGIVRLIYPYLGITLVIWLAEHNWGLLYLFSLPTWANWLLTFLFLDFAYYLQHRLLHTQPLLWRLHRVHHTDRDYDFSTGLRFHPIEAIFTVGFDCLVLIAIGPPPEAAALYLLLHLAWSILVHANIAFPIGLDRWVRKLLVTPDLHRIHHSAEAGESMRNFAAVTPLWDHLFGSYQDQPLLGQKAMVIGLADYQDAKHQEIINMLQEPFSTKKTHTKPPA